MDGDVLYVASGSESTINMFDLANNLTLLGPFVVFSELFYLVPTFTTLSTSATHVLFLLRLCN
jgi:hypothetical protein